MTTGQLFIGVIRLPIELPPNTNTYRCWCWIQGVSGTESDFVKCLVGKQVVKNYDLTGRDIADVPVGSEVLVKQSSSGSYFIERITKEQSIEAPETPSYQPVQSDIKDYLDEEPVRTTRKTVAVDAANTELEENLLYKLAIAKRRIRDNKRRMHENEREAASIEEQLIELGAL
jgi:hypothetical protein